MYFIDKNKCNGCAACVRACKKGAIYVVDTQAIISNELCDDCGECISVCSANAIIFRQNELTQSQRSNNAITKTSLKNTIKTALVGIGSTLIPIAISKIGDMLENALESNENSSTSGLRGNNHKGMKKRQQHRRGKRF